MKGIRPIELVHESLQRINLPVLDRPSIAPTEGRTKAAVQLGTKLYTYSLIAHLRNTLGGLIILANGENVPAAYPVCRHIFEWGAHACFINTILKECFHQRNWEEAWKVLTPAVIGNLWVKKYGDQYAPTALPPLPDAPDPYRIGIAMLAYEDYQLQKYGFKDAKITYGLLSELSHPNAACLQHYQIFENDGSVTIGFIEHSDGADSPLPFVNRTLLGLLPFLDSLLYLAEDVVARRGIQKTLVELARLAPRTKSQAAS
jgi:hypothetical protein